MAKKTPSTKPKKEKDPDAPKQPASAFILFSKHRRNQLKEAKSEISEKDKMRVIAQDWNKLSEKEKKVRAY